jgi:hypothetical protein
LTITRAQEGTSARTVTVGDQIAAVITPKHFADLETAFTGDSGSGGSKGLVPAPASGDASKFLKGDGTWAAASGGTVTPKLRVYTIFEGAMSAPGGTDYTQRFTKGTGTGSTITYSSAGVNLNNGTNSAGFSYIRFGTGSDANFSIFGGNIEFTHACNTFISTSSNGYIDFRGLGNDMVPNAAGITQTGHHIGWITSIASSTRTDKYSVGDGTTQSSGTFTSSTGPVDVYYIVGTGTSSMKFYKNGTLVGTLTSNIPSGYADSQIVLGNSNGNSNTANVARTISMAEYTKELY